MDKTRGVVDATLIVLVVLGIALFSLIIQISPRQDASENTTLVTISTTVAP